MTTKIIPREDLFFTAKAASQFAYCPYSKFQVGAAILTASGEVYRGCNVENASYGLTICAERNAIFQMIQKSKESSDRKIVALAIYTPTQSTTAPCGGCRQVLREFSDPTCLVGSCCDSGKIVIKTLSELLPDSFGPENLK